ncbi:MAG: flippase-like domain-containing protein [Chloroflexi bacterium]|nr:flippase-like domain-containing protein [Chloroflexota bacterium]MBU1751061.1 flippase-like domain-containing protein [Chloroflexota bacterium]
MSLSELARRAYAVAKRLRLLWLVVGLAFFAAVIWFSGVSDLDRIARIDPVYVLGALACTFGLAVSSAARWGVLVDALAGGRSGGAGHVAPTRQYYHYFIIGRAVSQVFPDTLSDVSVRSLALRLSHQYAIDAAIYSIAVDRVFDLATYLVYLAPAALFVVGVWPFEWAAGATALIFVAGWLAFELWPGAIIGTTIKGYTWLLRLAARVPFLARRLGNREQMAQVADRRLSRGQARRLYLFNLLKLAFTFLRLWCFALALDLPIAPSLLFFGMAIAQLSQAFAFTPGNLGTLELGWYAVLAVGGVDRELIGAYLLVQRILIAACVGLLGGISYAIITLFPAERAVEPLSVDEGQS